jgi:hypothetical protein
LASSDEEEEYDYDPDGAPSYPSDDGPRTLVNLARWESIHQVELDDGEDVVPQDEVDLSDDESPFENDESEFRNANGLFSDVQGTSDLHPWTPPDGMNVVALTDTTAIQRDIPQPESGEEPRPCPLNPETVWFSDFRLVKTRGNRVDMIHAPKR